MSRRQLTQRPSGLWTYAMPSRWIDMDALGHINNAVYFRYAESARLAFFAEALPEIEIFDGGTGPILADIGCAYHQQLRHPVSLEVGVRITRIGSSSFDIHCPVFCRGENTSVADMHSVMVWFDYHAQKPAPVPEALKSWLVAES